MTMQEEIEEFRLKEERIGFSDLSTPLQIAITFAWVFGVFFMFWLFIWIMAIASI